MDVDERVTKNVIAGDFVRGGQIESISYLLQNGVRVALIYGMSQC